MTIRISKSEIDQFHRMHQNGKGAFVQDFKLKGLRRGQAFHQYFKLEKITNEEDKKFCDVLYNATDEEANIMIASIMDHGQ